MKKNIMLVIVLLFCVLPCRGMCEKNDVSKKRFSVEVEGKSLLSICGELSRKADTRILLDEELQGIEVNGVFTDVTLEEFFRRTLRKENVVVESSNNNEIIVHRFAASAGLKKIDYRKYENGFKLVAGSIPDLTLRPDIRQMQKEQLSEFAQRENDPDAIEPQTGMKKADLQAVKDNQLATFSQWENDPDAKDPMTGLRKGELKKRKEQQLMSYSEWQEDPNSEDFMTGKRLGDLRKLQQQQLLAFDKKKEARKNIDPTTGKPILDVEKINSQARQLKNK